MSLMPNTLAQGLENIKFSSDPASAAVSWSEAWWGYAKGCIQINPITCESLAKAAFILKMLPAFNPQAPSPDAFFLALGLAMTQGWTACGTPATMVVGFLSIVPNPAPLGPLCAAVAPVGLASKTNVPPCQMLATIIDGWTRLFLAMPIPPATVGVPLA